MGTIKLYGQSTRNGCQSLSTTEIRMFFISKVAVFIRMINGTKGTRLIGSIANSTVPFRYGLTETEIEF